MGITAIAFEAMAVNTAMPLATEALNDREWYAWVFSSFSISTLFATIASGRLSDAIGPVKPMIAGMVIFGIGLIVAGAALSMPQLIAGRAIQGLGGGGMAVAIYVIIAQAYPPEARPAMMSWISTAWVLPGLIGPLLSGWIAEAAGWHWVFYAVMPVVALAAGLMVPTLLKLQRIRAESPPESDPAANRSPIWAAGIVAAALPMLQLGAQVPGWWSIGLIGFGVGLMAIGLPRLLPVGVWRLQRGPGPVIVVRALIAGVFFSAEAFIVLMLDEVYHLPAWLAGLVLTVSAVGWSTGSFIQARWKIRRDLLMTSGTSAMTVGVLAVVAVIASQTTWFVLIGAVWAIAALGMGLTFASTTVAIMALSSDAEQGRNASALQLGEALGNALIVGGIGALYAHQLTRMGAGNPQVFVLLLLVAAALVGIAIMVTRRIGSISH